MLLSLSRSPSPFRLLFIFLLVRPSRSHFGEALAITLFRGRIWGVISATSRACEIYRESSISLNPCGCFFASGSLFLYLSRLFSAKLLELKEFTFRGPGDEEGIKAPHQNRLAMKGHGQFGESRLLLRSFAG